MGRVLMGGPMAKWTNANGVQWLCALVQTAGNSVLS
jgi:hypothetical protein